MSKKSKIYQLKVANSLKVVRQQKNEISGKIHPFDFKNSNIIIEGIIQKRKDFFFFNLKQKIILSINFIFAATFFFIASS